jgi:pyrimidine deaminase RibD-like protein
MHISKNKKIVNNTYKITKFHELNSLIAVQTQEMAGHGLDRLRAAGIAIDCGLLADEARELNIGFVSRPTTRRLRAQHPHPALIG